MKFRNIELDSCLNHQLDQCIKNELKPLSEKIEYIQRLRIQAKDLG